MKSLEFGVFTKTACIITDYSSKDMCFFTRLWIATGLGFC